MEAVFPILALLACPLLMGGCMWMMTRSKSRSKPEPSAATLASVAELRTEQRRLAAEIERLEHSEAPRRGEEDAGAAPSPQGEVVGRS